MQVVVVLLRLRLIVASPIQFWKNTVSNYGTDGSINRHWLHHYKIYISQTCFILLFQLLICILSAINYGIEFENGLGSGKHLNNNDRIKVVQYLRQLIAL